MTDIDTNPIKTEAGRKAWFTPEISLLSVPKDTEKSLDPGNGEGTYYS